MQIDASALARSVYQAFNDRAWSAAVELAAPDVEVTIVPFGMTATGREGFQQFMQSWVEMSSDIKVEVTHQHEFDGGVVNEILATGTHDGPFVTPSGVLPPSGRDLAVQGVEVWEIDDGKLTRLRNYIDASTLWMQVVDPARVEARVQAFYDEVANTGDYDRIPEFATEGWVDHEAFEGISPGREGIGEFLTIFRSAFPDLHFTVDEVLVAGDKATCRIRMSGTHQGEFMGAPATGKSFEITTIDILRMEGDRAAEHWGVTDALGMMQQLGLTDQPANA